jgi:hypothetical protein
MTGMAANPFELWLMFPMQRDVTAPKVFVFFVFEIFLLPVPQPTFLYGLYHVLGVRIDSDRDTCLLDGFESNDNGKKFHPVVCGELVSLAEFLFVRTITHDRSVTTRTWVALRGTISKNVDHHEWI